MAVKNSCDSSGKDNVKQITITIAIIVSKIYLLSPYFVLAIIAKSFLYIIIFKCQV